MARSSSTTLALVAKEEKDITKSLTAPKLIEYGGYIFPGDTTIPQQKRYYEDQHKKAVIAEGRRITSALIRDKDFKTKAQPPKVEIGKIQGSEMAKKSCLLNILFGPASIE